MELNRDCLFTIFTFLPSHDLVTKRLTCHEWNHVCSANSLWQRRFLEELGPPLEEVASYLHEYCHWMNRLPAPSTESRQQRIRKTTDHDHMKLHCDPDQVNETSHQLAVILSLLNVNQNRNRFTDTMRIGTVESGSRPILLSQFCYLLSTGQQEALLCQKEDSTKESYDCDRIAISDNREGTFVPLVNFNCMKGQISTVPETIQRFGPKTSEHLEKKKFGNEEDIHSVYWWTSKRSSVRDRRESWSHVFWNSSFLWYNTAKFISMYNPNTQMISVLLKVS